MELLFYDMEVFKDDTLVVFKDRDKNVVGKFWNNRDKKLVEDPTGFEDAWKLIKGKTLIGYNNYWYDDIVLSFLMRNQPQPMTKALNDSIINGANHGIKPEDKLHTLDCFQQIDVSKPSLKLIEGNMGKSILESSIPFDIDRPLRDEERKEVEIYCEHDVDATIDVFNLREYNYFNVKNSLLTMLDDPSDKSYRWNTTTLSASILTKGKAMERWTKLRIPKDKWRNVIGIPEAVWEMWEKCENLEDDDVKGLSKTYEMFGNEIKFAFGGLHGAPKEPGVYRDVKLLDVSSMYPSIIILLKALGKSTDIYNSIRKKRLEVKETDKLLSNALKLILNSVYGNLKNKYSPLFNTLASRTVCIYGQMALFELCRELDSAGYRIMNINTDGVAFTGETDDYKIIWKDWETKWGLNLELDEFDTWYQKDVSNYVATKGDSIKVKGGDVNKFHFDPENNVHRFFSNNNTRITDLCIVNYLLRGKAPEETIMENLDKPILFQYVLRAGRTFKGVYDEAGNKMQNVNRVFAVRSSIPYNRLYKIREDGGKVNFPDAPSRMWVWNDDVDKIDKEEFAEKLDIQHYVDLAARKISAWPDPYNDWRL